MNKNQKSCLLCEEKTKPWYTLCSDCYKKYKKYRNEKWFIELEQMDKVQRRINRKECLPVLTDYHYGRGTPVHQKIGRRKISDTTIKAILEWYDKEIEKYNKGEYNRKPSLHSLAMKQEIAAPTTFKTYITKYRKHKEY